MTLKQLSKDETGAVKKALADVELRVDALEAAIRSKERWETVKVPRTDLDTVAGEVLASPHTDFYVARTCSSLRRNMFFTLRAVVAYSICMSAVALHWLALCAKRYSIIRKAELLDALVWK